MTAIIKPPIQAGGNLVKTGSTISDGPGLVVEAELTAAILVEANARTVDVDAEEAARIAALALKADTSALATEITNRAADVDAEEARATAQENLKLAKAANLSDVANASTAQSNLGAASPADVAAAVAALVDSSPATLDTLNELAAALGDDPNFATTVTNAIGAEATTRANADTTLQTNIDGKQAGDADLTAIAALTTTAFGRTFLDLADAAAARTKLALGTAAQSAVGDFQPTDGDLTAIAALSTTSFGRSLLEAADAAALRVLAGSVAKAGDTMTGPLVLPSGTAAAPGLRVGTPASGIYEFGGGALGWTILGTSRVTMTGTVVGFALNLVPDAGSIRDLGTAALQWRDLFLSAGLHINEGTNKTMGVATLVGGTVTVNTTKVTANSRIQLTIQSLGTVATPKAAGVTARTAGTSFTITSADATDTSVVAWLIVEP